ncbi:MAG TPA: M48 family metallopeptidase, partial [Burkholderiales bacterium]|nr:M48 family metallopeptidase [Burkholderiales bacterium]
LAAGAARGQGTWQMPARFARPDVSTDEGGLWAMMDREERRLRRSPFNLRDAKLHAYVQDIACRLTADHCPDVRVYLVSAPFFNASMAPNGMMQVWSGLMLRVDNEAQLATVLGHEIGHYLQRHSVERLRDAKTRAAFGQFLGLFGVVGMVGQLGMIAGAFAYGQDHEREADAIGIRLMRNAGYDPAEAAKVWENLLVEVRARPEGESTSPFFATHPPVAERQETLARLAQESPGGATREAAWSQQVAPHIEGWLAEEVRRGSPQESIALFTRLMARSPGIALYPTARGEVYRLRAGEGDLDRALADYQAALAAGAAPATAHRGMGLVYRARREAAPARASFARYLESAPQAPDFTLIKSYMEELPL